MDLKSVRKKLEAVRQDKLFHQRRIKENTFKLSEYEEELSRVEEARSFVQIVAKIIQSQLEFKISDISTKALQVVISEDISMKLEFVAKRGNSEVNIYFEKDGELIEPMEACGMGLVDIGSFALRISVWKISKPKSSPVFIFDEPFKNLSKNYHDAMYSFIQNISKKLGIQIIMITHEDDFIKNADRVFNVELIDKISQVQEEE